jgi:hypothetical protein
LLYQLSYRTIIKRTAKIGDLINNTSKSWTTSALFSNIPFQANICFTET